jgi:hypothetical protein
VERLKVICEHKMLAAISVDNAATIFHAADVYHAVRRPSWLHPTHWLLHPTHRLLSDPTRWLLDPAHGLLFYPTRTRLLVYPTHWCYTPRNGGCRPLINHPPLGTQKYAHACGAA